MSLMGKNKKRIEKLESLLGRWLEKSLEWGYKYFEIDRDILTDSQIEHVELKVQMYEELLKQLKKV